MPNKIEIHRNASRVIYRSIVGALSQHETGIFILHARESDCTMVGEECVRDLHLSKREIVCSSSRPIAQVVRTSKMCLEYSVVGCRSCNSSSGMRAFLLTPL